jgi:hypothetical protein
VSLLSPDTLHVFYAPTGVLALSRVGWRRRLGEARRYGVTGAGGEPWQDALGAFVAALKEFHCRRVRVVLSHHFVQYRVLPWRQDLGGDAEYRALAQLEFGQAFGALADDWSIALEDDRPGVPRVAAAVPAGLLAALTDAVTAAGSRLATVQPYLAVVAGLWDRQVDQHARRWLLLYEPGRICVAVRQAGAWCWLRHVRVGDDWAQGLPATLASEAMLAGLEARPADALVFAPGADRAATGVLRAAGFQVLEAPRDHGFVADRDGAFAPAWLG